jgi:hypothetical protein
LHELIGDGKRGDIPGFDDPAKDNTTFLTELARVFLLMITKEESPGGDVIIKK